MDSTYTCSDFPCALTMSELKQGFFWRGGRSSPSVQNPVQSSPLILTGDGHH